MSDPFDPSSSEIPVLPSTDRSDEESGSTLLPMLDPISEEATIEGKSEKKNNQKLVIDDDPSSVSEPVISLPKTVPPISKVSEPRIIKVDLDDSSEEPIVDASRYGETDDPYLGQTIGGYELVECLGHGGMGTVYKGMQVSLERMVAIKILNPALVNNAEFIKRFHREAKSIARITHQNIVGVHDFGESDGLHYMVIEYVAGTSLARVIAERLVLPAEEIVPIMVQCLAALEYVSRTGLVHRDIKPDNILLDEEGTAKIADFGLAKDMEGKDGDTDLTAHGSAMGTPAYMSPEQCMGAELDGRSDVYALGVTAYFALTGEKPFVGQSSFEIMTKHRELVPPAPQTINKRIPDDISALIMKMLAKKIEDRGADVEECYIEWCRVAERNGYMKSRGTEVWESGVHSAVSEAQLTVPSSVQSPVSSSAIPAPVDSGAMELAPIDIQSDVDMGIPAELPLSQGADAGLPASGHVPELIAPSASVSGVGALPIASAPTVVPERRSASVPTPFPEVPGSGSTQVESSRTGTEAAHLRRRSSGIMRTDSRFEEPLEEGSSAVQTTAKTPGEISLAARTCNKCGMINAPEDQTCTRCHEPLRAGTQADTHQEREKRAEELLKKGRARDAALLYARLAEDTTDRRKRSVLRAKERDARRVYEDGYFNDVVKRSENMRQQGNLSGSMQTLKRGIDETVSTTLSARLREELTTLRTEANKRRRRRTLLIVILLMIAGLCAAAWFMRDKLPFLQNILEKLQ